MAILSNIILALLIISSIVMIAAILILPPKENSMGQAIGGSEDLNLFGKKKSYGLIAILEKTVIGSASVFMVCAFVYNVITKFI